MTTFFYMASLWWRDTYPVFILVSLFMSFPPASAGALPATLPSKAFFQSGESLSYGISWSGIPVGSATMEMRTAAPIKRQPTLRLMTTATSNKYLSKLYPVHDRVESTVDAQSLLPFHMVFKRREGKRHDDFDITFNREEGRARVIKNGELTFQDIPPDILDALSCLYYLRRQLSLETGSSTTMHIHHNKKNYKIEVKVEGVEAITGPWGTLPAIRVLMMMPFEGIFLNQGNIRVWLTQDQDHTPLEINAKVTIGSIKAILQKFSSS